MWQARPAMTPRTAPQPAAVLGRVTLVTGKEEFLAERTVADLRAAVRALDAEAEISETRAGDLSMATLGELAAPSLFSSTRCVVVTSLEDLPEESVAGLLDYAAAPAEDVAVVLVHGGGQKGTGVLAKLRKLPTVVDVRLEEVKAHELTGFVSAEARRHGARLDGPAAAALVQSLGADLRGLAAAAAQLASDFPGHSLGVETVTQYFAGRAEAKSFAVADAALFGRRREALEELRWALDTGTAPVLVTSAFASGLRALARLSGAPRGAREGDLAKLAGVPPWKVRTLRGQLQGWEAPRLGDAIRAVAQADADIKGAATDASYTLERLVLTVTALHDRP